MSGFSPEWLTLREPVDHRSRDAALAEALQAHFASRASITVVDIGCGTGSNIRATHRLLGTTQNWTLVDYDPRLLAAARETLRSWADRAQTRGDALVLDKGGKHLTVSFRQADLNADLDAALGASPDLVTASALFDLCSTGFIETFADAVHKRNAAFYTVLTYNGIQTWEPAHPADTDLAHAFHQHQATDKGFGVSAGPEAPTALATAFSRRGFTVREGDSPWQLGEADRALVSSLADGFADAVAETKTIGAATLKDWRAIQRTGAVVGHTDTLALPR